jgi:hypothetical protein
MQRQTAKLTLIIVLIAAAGAVTWGYLNRSDLRESWRRWQQGPIPTAVSREALLAARQGQAPPSEELAAEPETPEPTVVSEPTAESESSPAQQLLMEEEPFVADPPPEPAEPAPAAAEPPPLAVDNGIPEALNLAVPMVYQAPFGVWDALHDDACEEAAILMIQGYLHGRTFTRQEMEDALIAMVDWEMDTFGFFKDTDAALTVRIMQEYLGLETARVVPVESMDDVREFISLGLPVVLPADGRMLQNPYFRGGGPPYHMLVAKGYKPGYIITNDPGTRRGADFLYDEDILWNAIHDWNGGDVPNGDKVILVAE